GRRRTERRRERLRDRRDPKRRLRLHGVAAAELEHAVRREHGVTAAQKPRRDPRHTGRRPRLTHGVFKLETRIHAEFATLPVDPVPARRAFSWRARAEARETTTEEAHGPHQGSQAGPDREARPE